MSTLSREELGRKICDIALLRGDFTLRSGKKSSVYLDKYLFETQPTILESLADALAGLLPPFHQFDRLAGPELGAVALVTALSLKVQKPFVIVRKSEKRYGTSKRVEGIVQPRDRLVLIEDVVTSGGQALEAALYLRGAGYSVQKILVVVDREQGGMEKIREAGFQVEALFRFSEWGITDQ